MFDSVEISIGSFYFEEKWIELNRHLPNSDIIYRYLDTLPTDGTHFFWGHLKVFQNWEFVAELKLGIQVTSRKNRNIHTS